MTLPETAERRNGTQQDSHRDGRLAPMGAISEPKDIVEAVIYLTEARHITGEVLRVDGSMHVGKW